MKLYEIEKLVENGGYCFYVTLYETKMSPVFFERPYRTIEEARGCVQEDLEECGFKGEYAVREI